MAADPKDKLLFRFCVNCVCPTFLTTVWVRHKSIRDCIEYIDFVVCQRPRALSRITWETFDLLADIQSELSNILSVHPAVFIFGCFLRLIDCSDDPSSFSRELTSYHCSRERLYLIDRCVLTAKDLKRV